MQLMPASEVSKVHQDEGQTSGKGWNPCLLHVREIPCDSRFFAGVEVKDVAHGTPLTQMPGKVDYIWVRERTKDTDPCKFPTGARSRGVVSWRFIVQQNNTIYILYIYIYIFVYLFCVYRVYYI